MSYTPSFAGTVTGIEKFVAPNTVLGLITLTWLKLCTPLTLYPTDTCIVLPVDVFGNSQEPDTVIVPAAPEA